MTRLLYLPDDATVIQLEEDLTPSQLSAAINAGMRPLAVLKSAPPGKLSASQVGSTVIIAPAPKRIRAARHSTKSKLSRRQAQVVELTARGLSSGEIALLLHIAQRTVNYHLNQVKSHMREGSIIQSLLAAQTTDQIDEE
jgi:DNA-binding NarL/FixJ family response regulator